MKIKRKSKGVSAPKVANGKGLVKGKLGSVIGKVGGLAARFGGLIPGVGGIISTVGKVAESVNDPEWWRHVPGTGVSTNIPLQNTEYMVSSARQAAALRPAIAEYTVANGVRLPTGDDPAAIDAAVVQHSFTLPGECGVITPSKELMDTYILARVREVVNAVPLQRVEAYQEELTAKATAYALKHNFDKFIYLSKTGKTFMPTLTDGSFPVLAAENYATLVGFRDRLAEYCSASVRLPHTLCEYLAWRFGRIYRSGESAKTGYILYNILDMAAPMSAWQTLVDSLLGFESAPTSFYNRTDVLPLEKSAAATDLYNSYKDHVQDVKITDDTQYHYDPKEFVLRTNLDVGAGDYPDPELIYMDSDLDEQTTFMASTVSTYAGGQVLFPVSGFQIYEVGSAPLSAYLSDSDPGPTVFNPRTAAEKAWRVFYLNPVIRLTTADSSSPLPAYAVVALALCKSLELYNQEIYITDVFMTSISNFPIIDATTMSQDLARVTGDVIRNTHTYAFANLVHFDTKSYAKEIASLYQEAEKVAADVVTDLTQNTNG